MMHHSLCMTTYTMCACACTIMLGSPTYSTIDTPSASVPTNTARQTISPRRSPSRCVCKLQLHQSAPSSYYSVWILYLNCTVRSTCILGHLLHLHLGNQSSLLACGHHLGMWLEAASQKQKRPGTRKKIILCCTLRYRQIVLYCVQIGTVAG
jgi:hypothetical protein